MDTVARFEIVEEPAPKLTRFRYLSEGRSGPLLGVNTTGHRKTYPSIKIVNYTGKASVVVSCVTKDEPYRPHPHALVGKNCSKGVCYIPNFTTNSNDPTILSFSELRIQCCKKKDIAERLKERKPFKIYPFGKLSHQEDNMKRDLHSLRLCFQVTIYPDPQNPDYKKQLRSKVSQPIANKIAATELKIHDISDASSPESGGKKIMIFCNKVCRRDIQIQFFEENANQEKIWVSLGKLEPHNVHRDVGISFTTPKYRLENIDKPQNVFIELFRPSDSARSERLLFQYVPDATNIDVVRSRKLKKVEESQVFFDYLATLGDLSKNVEASVQESLHYHEEQPQQQQIVQQPDEMQPCFEYRVQNPFPYYPIEEYQPPQGNYSRDPQMFNEIQFSGNDSFATHGDLSNNVQASVQESLHYHEGQQIIQQPNKMQPCFEYRVETPFPFYPIKEYQPPQGNHSDLQMLNIQLSGNDPLSKCY